MNNKNIIDVYHKKLAKSLELIETCFNLKEAYLKQIYPGASQQEINSMIFKGILSRKEKQWKSQKALLKH